MIDRFLQHFIRGLSEHLSEERLESLFCRELSFVDHLIARAHLARCADCRHSHERHGRRRVDEVVDLYREALNGEEQNWSLEPEPAFALRLERHLQQLPPRSRFTLRLPKLPLPVVSFTNPKFAALGLLGCVAGIFFGWYHRAPEISSNAFLVRAEMWDLPNQPISAGVVYQSIRITGPQLTIDRSIYRDLERKRSVRPVKLAASQEELKAELAAVGVDWDEPISALDYRTWHDQQSKRTDRVARPGAHLLKLTTTVPDASGAQSLTVRDTDFHPIQRTVALRDVGTVEIAELDYKVIPLAEVSADVFEPLADVSSPVAASRARVLEFPRLPQIVTQAQLDEAELSARLMLNQLHADHGEQIEIQRRQEEIVVEGVVETDQRKRELQTQLRLVPHVTVEIQSEAALDEALVTSSPTKVQVASMPDLASPLEQLLQRRGRSVSDINALAQALANTALTISQESKAVVDLQTRFASNQQLTIIASATLSELIYSHRERLETALKSEQALIVEAQIAPVATTENSGLRSSSLIDVAGRNLALSKELTQTTHPARRSAEQILAEMSVSISDLTVSANDMYGKSHGASTLSGKK